MPACMLRDVWPTCDALKGTDRPLLCLWNVGIWHREAVAVGINESAAASEADAHTICPTHEHSIACKHSLQRSIDDI